jgi:hypothetical protein
MFPSYVIGGLGAGRRAVGARATGGMCVAARAAWLLGSSPAGSVGRRVKYEKSVGGANLGLANRAIAGDRGPERDCRHGHEEGPQGGGCAMCDECANGELRMETVDSTHARRRHSAAASERLLLPTTASRAPSSAPSSSATPPASRGVTHTIFSRRSRAVGKQRVAQPVPYVNVLVPSSAEPRNPATRHWPVAWGRRWTRTPCAVVARQASGCGKPALHRPSAALIRVRLAKVDEAPHERLAATAARAAAVVMTRPRSAAVHDVASIDVGVEEAEGVHALKETEHLIVRVASVLVLACLLQPFFKRAVHALERQHKPTLMATAITVAFATTQKLRPDGVVGHEPGNGDFSHRLLSLHGQR